MNRVVVFTGPSLAPDEARARLAIPADVRPPARRGDILRALATRPTAIALIDGVFDQAEGVLHKELLAALAAGVHCLGAASMGALRAVELAAFGMEGVGAVFEAFRSGALEDDDEVAVAHAPAEHACRALSVALVDLRFSLAAAVAAGAIDAASRDALVAAAKRLFYPDRVWPAIAAAAAADGLAPGPIARAGDFLTASPVAQKRSDALALIARVNDRFAGPVAPVEVRWRFQHTVAWEQIRAAVAAEPSDSR